MDKLLREINDLEAVKQAAKEAGAYLAIEQIGTCRICKKQGDLRCGVCFTCCDQVAGQEIAPGVHLLWDSKNQDNAWIVEI
jgi:hypothetical protein